MEETDEVSSPVLDDFNEMDSPEPGRSSPVESIADSNFSSVSGSRRVVQQDVQQSRIRQRLDACRVGIQKLDLLRDKHQQIMQEMRSQLGIVPAIMSGLDVPELSVMDTQTDEEPVGRSSDDVIPSIKLRLPSPTPSSADWSSSISHRSSLSMDSGCLSMTSASELLAYQSSNGIPRKLSLDSKNPVTSPDGTILGKMRQKFFAAKLTEKLLEKNPVRKLSTSTVESRNSYCDDEGISADLMSSVIESTAAPPPPVPAPRYRKRSMTNKQQSTNTTSTNDQPTSRPKSLYTYPEENTVVVESLSKSSEAPASIVHAQTMERKSPKPMRAQTIDRSPKTVRSSPRIIRSESVQMLRGRKALSCTSLSRSMSVVSAETKTPSEACVFRASRVFITPQDNSPPGTPKTVSCRKTSTPPSGRRKILPAPGRPQSLACDPYRAYDSNLDKTLMFQKKNRTTWEDVKRMLDPLFEERTSPKLASRQNSESDFGTMCKFLSSAPSPTGSAFVSSSKSSPLLMPRHSFVTKNVENGQGTNHVILSRSISSQSSDSNKSMSNRRKEKQWHESEGL